MRPAPLVVAPLAESDLIEIGEFIARDNLGRALTFVDELRDFLQVVADAPGMGRVRRDLAGAPHSIVFRRFPYTVFYEPLEEGEAVRILRILHGARDHSQIFGSP